MNEFGFELSLCACLEQHQEAIIARQLGASVARSGGRILDIVTVMPGPQFDERTTITDRTIPPAVIEAPVGPGQFRPAREVFDMSPQRRQDLIDQAVDVGFLEQRRAHGRTELRQVCRYPEAWFSAIVGIENKPDLGTPGALDKQLRIDASLGVVDYAVVATESHVTRAHLAQFPDPVGVWEYTPGGSIDVIRPPARLSVDTHGVELTKRHTDRTDIAIVSPRAKRRMRRRIAERAYGKGWRTYQRPDCACCQLRVQHGTPCLPYCHAQDRVVRPHGDCGVDCARRQPTDDTRTVDWETERARRTPWVSSPDGRVRTQAGLDQFG